MDFPKGYLGVRTLQFINFVFIDGKAQRCLLDETSAKNKCFLHDDHPPLLAMCSSMFQDGCLETPFPRELLEKPKLSLLILYYNSQLFLASKLSTARRYRVTANFTSPLPSNGQYKTPRPPAFGA